jgi:hypothetical protein
MFFKKLFNIFINRASRDETSMDSGDNFSLAVQFDNIFAVRGICLIVRPVLRPTKPHQPINSRRFQLLVYLVRNTLVSVYLVVSLLKRILSLWSKYSADRVTYPRGSGRGPGNNSPGHSPGYNRARIPRSSVERPSISCGRPQSHLSIVAL